VKRKMIGQGGVNMESVIQYENSRTEDSVMSKRETKLEGN